MAKVNSKHWSPTKDCHCRITNNKKNFFFIIYTKSYNKNNNNNNNNNNTNINLINYINFLKL